MNTLQTSLFVMGPSGLQREGGAVCSDMIFSLPFASGARALARIQPHEEKIMVFSR